MLCLGTIYLVWGSSFLFSKIAVNNLPIALFSADSISHRRHLALVVRAFLGRPSVSEPPARVAPRAHRRILHGVRQQWAEHLGHSLHPDQSVGAAQRNSGVLDRGLGDFRTPRPSADAVGRSRHVDRIRGHSPHADPEGLVSRVEPAGAVRRAHRVLRLGHRHDVLPQHRHALEFADVHGHADVHGRTDAADGGRRSRRSRALDIPTLRASRLCATSPFSAPAWPIPPMAGSASMRRRR